MIADNPQEGVNYLFQDLAMLELVGAGWYPGDEWKGDVARMIMYMYLRYNTRCLPNNVGLGTPSILPMRCSIYFLQWNAEDPVSTLEIQRNDYYGNTSTAPRKETETHFA